MLIAILVLVILILLAELLAVVLLAVVLYLLCRRPSAEKLGQDMVDRFMAKLPIRPGAAPRAPVAQPVPPDSSV